MGIRVREKPNGSGIYWIFINHHGKRKSKKIGKDKKLASECAEQLGARLVLGELNISKASPTPTLKEYIFGWNDNSGIYPGWLRTFAEISIKRSTRKSYEGIIKNHLSPAFGNKILSDISSQDISIFIYQLFKKQLRSQTIKNIKNCLSAILRSAYQDNYIPVNPAQRVKIPKPEGEKPKREPDPFGWQDREILEDTFRKFKPFYYPLVLCGFRTGLRIGELIGLKWEDIDFKNRQIFVQRAFSRGYMSTPKSKAGRRFVRMTSQLAEVLQEHRERLNEMKGNRFKCWQDLPEWVFPNEAGNRINYGNFLNRVWNKTMLKSGLRRRTPHDMRHTWFTLRLSNGDPLHEVSKEGGHGSPELTYRTYYKWLPNESRTDIDALDNRKNQTPKRTLSAPKMKKELGNVA
jgi:integrase